MKIIALLLIIFGVLFIAGFGVMWLLLFAMSFDAPGSVDNAGIWGIHLVVLLLFFGFILAVIYATKAYRNGNYARSMGFSSFFALVFLVIALFLGISSKETLQEIQASNTKAAEDVRLYPTEKFIRRIEGGADTIIVFPSRIVAYRLYVKGGYTFGCPVGDLNEARDTIFVNGKEFDEKIGRGGLSQFLDERGRKLTEVFIIK